jgi:N-acetylgalactosamine-6-sulfatase
MIKHFLSSVRVVILLATMVPCHAAERPNILVILADDLGWGDLSCYGQRRFETPHLDALAAGGTLFTQATMAGSVCSPSRAALVTGRFPARVSMHGHIDNNSGWNEARGIPQALDPKIDTLPLLLQENGYRTIHVGKWHLGPPHEAATRIQNYGFDDVRWPHCMSEDRSVNLWAPEHRPQVTAKLADATFDAMKQAKADGKPFYAQLWLNDPHSDLAPSAEEIAKFDDPVRSRKLPYTTPFSIYAASVTVMDRALGNLFERMKEAGLRDNTLIVFSSDNGPEEIEIRSAQWSGAGSAGPLRGRKRSLYEGGIRVPFIASWPGNTPAGRIDQNSVINAVDLFPTFAALAGVSIPQPLSAQLDGEDVSQALRGDGSFRRKRPLMWEWREEVVGHVWNQSPMLAMRDGDWKLLMNPDRSRMELYQIQADPGERDNRASAEPETVSRMSAALMEWSETLPQGAIHPRAGKDSYPWPSKNAR